MYLSSAHLNLRPKAIFLSVRWLAPNNWGETEWRSYAVALCLLSELKRDTFVSKTESCFYFSIYFAVKKTRGLKSVALGDRAWKVNPPQKRDSEGKTITVGGLEYNHQEACRAIICHSKISKIHLVLPINWLWWVDFLSEQISTTVELLVNYRSIKTWIIHSALVGQHAFIFINCGSILTICLPPAESHLPRSGLP